jgi:hypothetical protein
MPDIPQTIRTGYVIAKGNKTDHEYQRFLVRQEADGGFSYYHGGPTCNTSDRWVTMPAEWLDKVRWDSPPPPSVYQPEDES